MRRERFRWVILLLLFNFLLFLSAGCFAANFFTQQEGRKGIFRSQALEKNEAYDTRLEEGKIVRDYTKLSRVIDQKIKESLLASGIKLKEITKVTDKKMSKELGYQGVDRVVWQYWDEKINTTETARPLPEVVLRLTGQIEKNKGKVLKTIWEENQQNRSVMMQIGFQLQGGKEPLSLITHTLHIRQNINQNATRGNSNPKALIALIIDDFGAMMPGTMEMLSIDRPLTIAVLPYRSTTAKEAQLAKERGYEVILHLPMEPHNPKTSAGPGAIKAGMTFQEVKELFAKAIQQVPEAQGVNNHMGSKATEDRKVVNSVLQEVKARGLFFVDSHTSTKSVVPQEADKVSVPWAENYLFIDNVDQVEAVKNEIKALARVALTKGSVIGIGHVRVNTVAAIKEMIPQLEAQGIKLVFVSELVQK